VWKIPAWVYCIWEVGAEGRRQIGGSTLHSWSGVGRGQQSLRNLVEKIRHSEQAVRRWQETDALIIDESKYWLICWSQEVAGREVGGLMPAQFQ
jgi:hypothetical protein